MRIREFIKRLTSVRAPCLARSTGFNFESGNPVDHFCRIFCRKHACLFCRAAPWANKGRSSKINGVRVSYSLATVLFIVLRLTGFAQSLFTQSPAEAASPNNLRATIGAYYYDGWTGDVAPLLKTEFADRKPAWGWKDNTPEIMRQQIDYCANHGLAFWAFDWYYPKEYSRNNALNLYLKAPDRNRLQFCLLVANHNTHQINPTNWQECCQIWIDLFSEPTYLRIGGHPLIIFFSPKELERTFGSTENVRRAFSALRKRAKEAKIDDIAIAACTNPKENWGELVQSGYTLFTGYNYHDYSEDGKNRAGAHPFNFLVEASQGIFREFGQKSPLPYIPVVTTGWDRRPWEDKLAPQKRSPWYPGRTPERVEEFVRMGIHWLDSHPDKATRERLLLLYAWNENGEGGYLTPTKADGTAYLEAVQRALESSPADAESKKLKNFDGIRAGRLNARSGF